MPRRFIKRYMPAPHTLREHKHLRIYGDRLRDPNVWHLNRRSVSGAVAVGLFSAYLPIPFEMVVAAFLALVFRVNLPISVALVWISNPLTWAPLYAPAYLLGAYLIPVPNPFFDRLGLMLVAQQYVVLWAGCMIIGPLVAIIGYFSVQGAWRFYVVRAWRRRTSRRKEFQQKELQQKELQQKELQQ